MQIQMLRIDDSGCFDVPNEYDTNGVKIKDIIVGDIIIPKNEYVMLGSRKVDIVVVVPKSIPVYAIISIS